MRPRLSIITVTYQAERHLVRTLESTASQTWRDWEHVFVDGGSTDGTLPLIRSYLSRAPAGSWISEPDQGLYDAMNKGIRAARGEYLVFLNAGDAFWDERTLEQLFTRLPEGVDVLYGDHRYMNEVGEILPRRRARPYPVGSLRVSHFRTGMAVCHQAVFVRREVAPFYDLRYRLAADLDWIIRLMRLNPRTYDTGRVVVRYLTGGVSARRLRSYVWERTHILYRHFGPWAVLESLVAMVARRIRGGYPFRG
ncbi:MAG: glycosyltransferase [Bacteroidia bacterium]|nr:glycosyltransferase [Bacteroidia bacterium]